MRFRFTLSHDVLGSQVIDEPGGWDQANIILERDPSWYSLIERYEAGNNGSFLFYGNNDTIDGGVDFVRQAESTYGPDTEISAMVEVAMDDVTYETVFEGMLKLYDKTSEVDNKIQVPIVRDDFWSKFINRLSTPVNLSSLVDLDGNSVDAVIPVTVNLIDQYINQYFVGFLPESTYSFTGGLGANDYIQIDFDDTNEFMNDSQKAVTIDEIDEHIGGYPIIDNPEQPSPSFQLTFPGDLTINNLTIIARNLFDDLTTHLDADIKGYVLINDSTEYELTRTDYLGSNGLTRRSRFEYSGSITDVRTIAVYLKNDSGSTSSAVGLLFDDQVEIGVPSTYTTTFDFFVKTKYRDSQADGYLIHDAMYGVLQRIGLGNTPFYSEFLGSALTTMRQYGEDGCGWSYALIKGLQIRQYSLTDKPFFISFKELWDGINPILNLSLIPDQVLSTQVIRVEEKEYQFDNLAPSLYLSNVRDISSQYDQQHIFKTIKSGYKKWQSEDAQGIDEVQTKQTRATRIKQAGTDFTNESDFIAAGLAIETTRRAKVKKNNDYKFDNDTFVISLNRDDVSPDVYNPELDENFDSVSNVQNSERRYNLSISPLRNFLRWANLYNGCLYNYQDSEYKFVSGEGNYDMISDYSCTIGQQCIGIICDSISESDDVELGTPENYWDGIGYLFIPEEFTIKTSMEWEEFLSVRQNPQYPIAISQGVSNYVNFFIKKLEYSIVKGEATITAWPYTPFSIGVPESLGRTLQC